MLSKRASSGHWKDVKTQPWSHTQFTEILSALGCRLCGRLIAGWGSVAMGTEKRTNKKMMCYVGGRPAGEQDAQPVRVCASDKAAVIHTRCNSLMCAAARRRRHAEWNNRPSSRLFIRLLPNADVTFQVLLQVFLFFVKQATWVRWRSGLWKCSGQQVCSIRYSFPFIDRWLYENSVS